MGYFPGREETQAEGSASQNSRQKLSHICAQAVTSLGARWSLFWRGWSLSLLSLFRTV